MKWVLALGLSFAFVGVVAADPAPSGPGRASAAERLERLKGLAGTWRMGEDDPAAPTVVYRVTAAGSAVMETLFAETPKEMVTLYTVDGDDLVLTHYCAMGNQPHMRAAPGGLDRIEFQFVSGGNLKSRDAAHMDSLVVTFGTTPGAMHQDWTMYADGKVTKQIPFDWSKKR